jgi:hypothetical protein
MVLNAYALFFASVLIGSLMLLEQLIRSYGAVIRAALRGEALPAPDNVAPPRLTRIQTGRRLALPPVVFSICRL